MALFMPPPDHLLGALIFHNIKIVPGVNKFNR